MSNSLPTEMVVESLVIDLVKNFNRAKYSAAVLIFSENIKASTQAETYVIQVIKAIIKSERKSTLEKYRALHLLKELLKVNDKGFRKLCDDLIMDRLKHLALSSYKERVLVGYNLKSNVHYSKKFYRLLLECFAEWQLNFGQSSRFFSSIVQDMRTLGIYPSFRRYYNRFQIFGEKSMSEYMAQIQAAREKFVMIFTSDSTQSLRNIESDLAFYNYEKLLVRMGPMKAYASLLDCKPEIRLALKSEFDFMESIRSEYFLIDRNFASADKFISTFREKYINCFSNELSFPDYERLFTKIEQRKVFLPYIGYESSELQRKIFDPLDAPSLESEDDDLRSSKGFTSTIASTMDIQTFGVQRSMGDIQLAPSMSNIDYSSLRFQQKPFVPQNIVRSMQELEPESVPKSMSFQTTFTPRKERIHPKLHEPHSKSAQVNHEISFSFKEDGLKFDLRPHPKAGPYNFSKGPISSSNLMESARVNPVLNFGRVPTQPVSQTEYKTLI